LPTDRPDFPAAIEIVSALQNGRTADGGAKIPGARSTMKKTCHGSCRCGTISFEHMCPNCGGHTLSRGYLEKQMGGNFWAVNVACLDDVTEEELEATPKVYEDGKRDRQDRAPEITGYL